MLNGAGRAAIQASTGEWEVIAYRNAVLGEDGNWTLTGLLRGLRGTEVENIAGHLAGARIVFLNDVQTAEALDPDYWGTTETWQAGPAHKPQGAFPYREESVSLIGAGARPFAPMHVSATLSGDNLVLSWVRRSRIGGDNWGVGDVPLGESAERYQVRAYGPDDGLLIDTETVNPSLSIPSEDVVRVEVAQISSSFGAGRASTLLIS